MSHHDHPRRLSHSQNFLQRRQLVQILVDSANLTPDDPVLEIGPGRGIITAELARRGLEVVAVEADEDLVVLLRARFAACPNVHIIAGDFLRFALPSTSYNVFASIPFDQTAAIVAKLTTAPVPPENAFLIMQAEAAERYVGDPRVSLLAVLLKPAFTLRIAHRFRRTDFTPVPHVDVVMLRLRKRGPPLVAPGDLALYRDFVTFCFTARFPFLRETLQTVVGGRRAAWLLDRAQLGRKITPSQVPFAAWLTLFQAFQSRANASDRQRIQGSYRRLLRQQAKLVKVHRTRPPPFVLASAGSRRPTSRETGARLREQQNLTLLSPDAFPATIRKVGLSASSPATRAAPRAIEP